MPPSVIIYLQKEFITEATSPPKLFWNLDKINGCAFAMLQRAKI